MKYGFELLATAIFITGGCAKHMFNEQSAQTDSPEEKPIILALGSAFHNVNEENEIETIVTCGDPDTTPHLFNTEKNRYTLEIDSKTYVLPCRKGETVLEIDAQNSEKPLLFL